MAMLRSWNGESKELLVHMLAQFGVQTEDLHLFKFEALTPDSFIWILSVNHVRYCLYAEDYVPSLQHVHDAMHSNLSKWNPKDIFKLMEVTHRQKWEDTSPVKAASTYKTPDKPEEFMKFAATSGYDFVFLGKLTPKESMQR